MSNISDQRRESKGQRLMRTPRLPTFAHEDVKEEGEEASGSWRKQPRLSYKA